ncbi:5390_t:CDS:2 [Diversispora eburnea]|uniref:5390_t:CDS:1 n=1 Tax=Diversispora eburnea TaxID=1213867 RepID=A0A9N8VC38_9GLOM|nr:5390_t:CDS:2 [Diversispora eburnea]
MATLQHDEVSTQKIRLPPNIYITNDVTDGSIINDSPPSPYIIQSPIDGTFLNFSPPSNSYIKTHKNVSFSYVPYFTTFQHGTLDKTDSYLMGVLHLNYEKPVRVKNVYLNLKGYEKTKWTKSQGRTKIVFKGEQTVVNQSYKIWEPSAKESDITNYGIPFKVKLPHNLPETLTTRFGAVYYILRATVYLKGTLVTSPSHSVEILCPLKRTLVLNNDRELPTQYQRESEILNYAFILPPGKNINIGVYLSIPLRIRFVKPGVSLEKIEVSMRTLMKFRSNTKETCRVIKRSTESIITRKDLKYLKPESDQIRGDCITTANLWIPRRISPTYYGKLINIAHMLVIKFIIDGSETNDQSFHVEETINIANIHKNFDVELPLTPEPTKFLNPRAFSLYPTTNDESNSGSNETDSINSLDRGDIEAAYAIVNQLYQSHLRRHSTSLDLSPSFFYDGSIASKFPPIPPIIYPLTEQPPIDTLFTAGAVSHNWF